jgi:LPLT family lysophospholipid transporter-like MFS transporter
MNKQIYPLLLAQFLSAFADNAILFAVVAMVLQSPQLPGWYVPALQSAFLLAYVVFAPWVGAWADQHPKARVLIVANLIKAGGAILLLLGIEPLAAYGIVGVGGALYSPAKYGILPELAGHRLLVKANSWIEGSTILAILLGMVAGAKVADVSVDSAFIGVIVLFLLSALATLWLPTLSAREAVPGPKLLLFGRQIGQFFVTARSRFAILGASLFWAVAATLRVILVAWAPSVLLSETASDIAQLTLFLALGIVAGSALAPSLIPLEQLRRVRVAAYLMGLCIVALAFTASLWPARAALLAIGMMGGIFIVPLNAALQELGQQSIGSGGAVAMQNFFQNAAMLLGVGAYTYAASLNASPSGAMWVLGGLTFIATLLISLRLPKDLPYPAGDG